MAENNSMAGISRSVTVVTAYLIASVPGLQTFAAAFDYVQKRRPIACPNAGFRAQLVEFEKQMISQREFGN